MKNLKEEIYGNKITFYHRTRIKELVQKIWTEGFNPGTGDMYGAGSYGTYDLESQDNNPKRNMKKFYGDITIKFAVPSDNFFFFDYDEFLKTPLYKKLKDVTRENYLDKQAQYYGFYNGTHIKENEYTSDSAKYVYKTLTDKKLPNYVSGIVFTGRMDGKVVVVYDTELIIPLTARIGDNNEFKKENLDEGYLRKWLNSTAGKQYIKKYDEYKYIDMFKKAIDNNDVEKVKQLLKSGKVDPSDNDNLAIQWASENGHTEVVKLLLADKRVDPSADDNYAIKWASAYGHTEVVKLLLADKRVDPSENDNYAIRMASAYGHTEVVKLLLADKRVDPSADDNYTIYWASRNGHTEVVKLLLNDPRVDPSDYEIYAIRSASHNGHTEVVKLLLQHPKVKESLSKEDYDKYSKQAGLQTESLNEYINLIEKKDHLIKKLNMTDEQKDEVIEYFNKFPHAENKIDWNNKDLTYNDFKKIMNKVSKTQKKKLVKQKGIKGLVEETDYLDLGIYNGYTAYVPLTYEASKLIASSNIGNVEGKWCTAYQKEDKYWFNYTDKNIVLVYFVKENDKIALAYSIDIEKYEIFNSADNKVYEDDINIDIDNFLNENREALNEANKKILNSDGRALKRKEKEFKNAVDNNDIEKVKELIKWGVDPSAGDNYAIGLASVKGNTEVVKLLLADPRVDPSADNNYAIRKASDIGRTEVVKLLLADERVDPSDKDNYAIRWASRNGYTEVVKLLLADPRVDPSDKDNYAICWASEYGHTEIVKLLLSDKRVNPTADDNYAIRWASANGHTEIVKLLLSDKRADPSADDNFAIYYASKKGHTEVIKLLLQHPKVKESLSKEDYEKYSKQAGLQTESLEDIVKNTVLKTIQEYMVNKL